jgi:hypothetical protein
VRPLTQRQWPIACNVAVPSLKEIIMQVTIEGKDLVIRIPMTEPRPSASGKTLVVATSSGNKVTDAIVQGQNVVIGLNAYIKK